MLILISIFNIYRMLFSNGQNNSPSDSHPPDRKLSHCKIFPTPPPPPPTLLGNRVKCAAIIYSAKETRQRKEQLGWRLVGEGEGVGQKLKNNAGGGGGGGEAL